ncbi:MAG: manganese efflux pump [Deltaproteobacteria bacterium]|nr:manganese efflux pump [Deltaproteobacteria bacterium]MCW5804470.1 manganese efflux pump [Deltaproteobacteria bacterium]
MLDAVVLALGLAMDATAVAAARSVAKTPRRDLTMLVVAFAVFQAGMAAIGWGLGASAERYIRSWDHWLAFGLLVGLGTKMLLDARGGGDDDDGDGRLGVRMLLALSLATSIDALAAGVTLPSIDGSPGVAIAMIGVVTLALSALGAALGSRLGARFGGRLEVVGGLALIAIGVKVLVDHLTTTT